MSIRTEQVESNLQKIIGEIFSRDVELPQDHLATITRVVVSPDLKSAEVFVSILPFDNSNEIMNIINRHKSHIQQEVVKSLSMKFSPVLEFKKDQQPEEASQIEKMIDEEMGLFDL